MSSPTGRMQAGPVFQRVYSQRQEEIKAMFAKYNTQEIIDALKELAKTDPTLPKLLKKAIEGL